MKPVNKIITKEEFLLNKNYYYRLIKEGSIFVYPTDTIYGIGCNALDEKSVKKIRTIKERYKNPFSVIAPSPKWVKENLAVTKNAEEWLKKLPGPYTLIMKKKKKCVAESVTEGQGTLGIRVPKHWISKAVCEMDFPIVTTSVNKTGREFMTSIEDLDPEIKDEVDFVIDEGTKKANPSTIIFLDKEEVSVKKR